MPEDITRLFVTLSASFSLSRLTLCLSPQTSDLWSASCWASCSHRATTALVASSTVKSAGNGARPSVVLSRSTSRTYCTFHTLLQ